MKVCRAKGIPAKVVTDYLFPCLGQLVVSQVTIASCPEDHRDILKKFVEQYGSVEGFDWDGENPFPNDMPFSILPKGAYTIPKSEMDKEKREKEQQQGNNVSHGNRGPPYPMSPKPRPRSPAQGEQKKITIHKEELAPLGIHFNQDRVVISIQPGTAAALSGLKPGDRIVTVNGVNLPARANPSWVDGQYPGIVRQRPTEVEILYTEGKRDITPRAKAQVAPNYLPGIGVTPRAKARIAPNYTSGNDMRIMPEGRSPSKSPTGVDSFLFGGP